MKILAMFFCVLAIALASMQAKASARFSAGVYNGSLTVGPGEIIPLKISLSFTDEEVPGEPDELLPFKKKMVGSLIIGNEGGPFTFSTVNYDVETGQIDLRYMRAGQTNGALPTLRFLGKLQKDGKITGQALSAIRGDLGTFVIEKGEDTRFVPVEITVGHWTGTFTFQENGTVVPFDVFLEGTSFSKQNPADLELEFTPGRIGSAQLGKTGEGLNIPFSEVVVDYMHNVIRMTYSNASGVNGNGGSLTLIAAIKGDEMTGYGTSTYKGKTGSFKVRRVK